MSRRNAGYMPRAMGLRVGGVVMPSELHGAGDQAPVDLGTYKLPWPELARYRGEELDMSHETAQQLFSRFAAGEGQTTADRKRLAAEIGKHRTTVDYHFEQWQIKGRPAGPEPVQERLGAWLGATSFDGSAAPAVIEQPPVQPLVEPPVAVFDPGPADSQTEQPAGAPAGPEPAAAEDGQDGATGEPDGEPESDPAPPVPAEPIATAFNGAAESVTTMAAALLKAGIVQEIPEAVAEGLPEVGAVYEGVIVRVDPGYVLVRIVDVRDTRGRHPIGKVHRYQTAERPPRSCADLGWAEGDLVNVKVLSVNRDQRRDKLYIDLSVRQAPPHPHGPTGRTSSPTEPTVARGADIAAEMTNAGTSEIGPSEATAEISRLKAELEATQATLLRQVQSEAQRVAEIRREAEQRFEAIAERLTQAERERLTQGLCASCLFRASGWCDYAESLPSAFEIPETHLREEHKGRRIVFGQAPITGCDLYRKGESA